MSNTEIYTAYAERNDITYIMKDTYDNGDLLTTEVVGWYYGEPDEKNTRDFIGDLVAVYDTENLKQRISDSIENELAEIYDELEINAGDITPTQQLKWDELTAKFADLFRELIKQNK